MQGDICPAEKLRLAMFVAGWRGIKEVLNSDVLFSNAGGCDDEEYY
jgi:hypothetical protein